MATAKLTPAMIAAINSEPNDDGERFARPATAKALETRGLAVVVGSGWFTLTKNGEQARREHATPQQLENAKFGPDAPIADAIPSDYPASVWEPKTDEDAAMQVEETYRCQHPGCDRAVRVVDQPAHQNAHTEEAELDERAEIEATNDAAADAELIEFRRAVDSQAIAAAPTTETDVRSADKREGLATLVQFGSKLVWGKLIAVVNRRTKYSSPLLVTVEISGIRRLISADEVLVSDTFVAA